MKRLTYFGVDIERHGPNTMGMNWLARVGENKLRSDTLAGMKRMIQEKLEAQTFDCYLQHGTSKGPFYTEKAPSVYSAYEKDCSLMKKGIPTNWKVKFNGHWHRMYMNISSKPSNFIKTTKGIIEVTVTSGKS